MIKMYNYCFKIFLTPPKTLNDFNELECCVLDLNTPTYFDRWTQTFRRNILQPG